MSTTHQIRYDSTTLQKPERDPKSGYLRVDAHVARTGVLPYLKPNGKVFREYRPPDEVFRADAMRSFEHVPFTNGHPDGLLSATNTREHQVGTVYNPRRGENGHVAASILVTDAATIKAIEGGMRQVSVGYLADVVETPGEVDGEHYDGVQTNIRVNHVSLVREARSGDSTAIRMDSASSAQVRVDSLDDVKRLSAHPHANTAACLADIASNKSNPTAVRNQAASTLLSWCSPGMSNRLGGDWVRVCHAVDRLGREAGDLPGVRRYTANRNGSYSL